MDAAALARFFSKVQVDPETGCWLWTAGLSSKGYGKFWLNGRTVGAHSAAYLHFIGPLEDGHEPDHLCRVRRCVFYEHLEGVPQRVNLLRGESFSAVNARKVTCIHGHNEWGVAKGTGWRYCKACHRESQTRINQRRSQNRRAARERRTA